MQFSDVERADETIRLSHEDFNFTRSYPSSTESESLHYTKTNSNNFTHFCTRGLHISICGLSAIIRWLSVLKLYLIQSIHLFPAITNNRLQPGNILDYATYGRNLATIGDACGIHGRLTEHSARRCGAGYFYFLLRYDLLTKSQLFRWDNMSQMLL